MIIRGCRSLGCRRRLRGLEAFEEVGLLSRGLGVGGCDQGVELLRAEFGEDFFRELHQRGLGDVLADGFGFAIAN